MRPNRGRRGGWALLELLVVITAATALLGLAAGLIHQMLKIDGAERSRVVVAADLERLAHDLRSDAHSAARLAESAPGRVILALAESRSVEYTVRGREILRTARRGEKVDHREQYRLPATTVARFESTGDRAGSLIAVVVTADPAASKGRPPEAGYRDYRIEAAVGRDGRLTGGGPR